MSLTQNRKFQNFTRGTYAAVSADGGTGGVIPLMYKFTTTASATNSQTITLDRAFTVTDAWAVLVGGAGTTSDTYQLYNDPTALSDAVSIASAGDADIVRIGELNDAVYQFSAGGTLKVTVTDGGGSDVPQLLVFVLGYANA